MTRDDSATCCGGRPHLPGIDHTRTGWSRYNRSYGQRVASDPSDPRADGLCDQCGSELHGRSRCWSCEIEES